MKKISLEFYLILTFCIIFALSYISDARGIQSQGNAFVYFSGVLIFFVAAKMALENLVLNYNETVVRQIMLMFGLFGSSFFVATFAIRFSVEMGIAFQLIVFGMLLGVIGMKIYEKIVKWLFNQKVYN